MRCHKQKSPQIINSQAGQYSAPWSQCSSTCSLDQEWSILFTHLLMLVAMIGDKLTRRSLAGQRSWRTQHTRRMQSWRIQSGEENENCLDKRNLAITLDFNMKYGETVDKPGLSKIFPHSRCVKFFTPYCKYSLGNFYLSSKFLQLKLA